MPKKIRCPKCKRPPIYYEEHMHEVLTWDADMDGTPTRAGSNNPGEPMYVCAVCNCGYSWRVKGVTQIIELRK